MQELIVILLILASVVYTVYNFIQVFIKKSGNSCGCSSCHIKSDANEIKALINKKHLQ